MNSDQQSHPLHGVGLKTILTELVDHYGWEILAEQINVNCFRSNPSIQSSHKFLHKVMWARLKTEAFYLYKFKQITLPDDEQHSLPPRERVIDLSTISDEPAEIELGDPEFFDDPLSGPVFPSKKAVSATRENSKSNKVKESDSPSRRAKEVEDSADEIVTESESDKTSSVAQTSNARKVDPWAKSRD